MIDSLIFDGVVFMTILFILMWVLLNMDPWDDRDMREKSFWGWLILCVVYGGIRCMRWVFSSGPSQLLRRIPRRLWGGVLWVKNWFLREVQFIGFWLTVFSMMGLLWILGMSQIKRPLYYHEVVMVSGWPIYLQLGVFLGAILILYGYWREEVRK
jgi:hypothetical protein